VPSDDVKALVSECRFSDIWGLSTKEIEQYSDKAMKKIASEKRNKYEHSSNIYSFVKYK
jgi:hypothetical protein